MVAIIPLTRAEEEEFNLRRMTSGLDGKQGLNVFVISGSVVGAGGGGVGGGVTTLSGSVTSVSGETVISKISGQTVIAKVSGELVRDVLEVSGSRFPGATLGLDSKEALNVFLVSGSVLGAGGGGPSEVTTLSGSVTSVSGETVIAKVSGETVVARVSGETIIAKVSGEALGRTWTLSEATDSVRSAVSGQTVLAKVSGETIVARVSGESVRISGQVVSVSGQPVGRTWTLSQTSDIVVAKVSGEALGRTWTLSEGTDSVRAAVSGQMVLSKVSGETVLAKVSGETVVAKVSGEKVLTSGDVALISGQPVGRTWTLSQTSDVVVSKVSGELVVSTLRVSGGQAPSAGGGLEPTFMPLHVLVVSGSVVGGAAPSDVHVTSGAVELYVSGIGRVTAKSGSLDLNAVPLHVLVVSGSVVGGAAPSQVTTLSGSVTSISGETVIAKVSGETVIAKISGEAVRISGQVVSVSGQPVGRTWTLSQATDAVTAKVSGETVIGVIRTSGGEAPSAGGGLEPTKTPLHVLVVSGSVVGGGGAAGDVHVTSGAVELYVSGIGRVTAKSGSLDVNAVPLHVLVVSGSVVGGAAPSQVTTLSGSVTSISGETVIARISGQTVIAKVSGEPVLAKVSGEKVLTSGDVALISGQPVGRTWTLTETQDVLLARISGQTTVEILRTSGGEAPSAGGGLEPTKTPLHVLVVSGSVVGAGGGAATQVTTLSGSVTSISGETVVARVSGQTVVARVEVSGGFFPGATLGLDSKQALNVFVVSGSVIGAGGGGAATQVTTLSGSVTSVSGETVIAKVSGETVIAKISGETVIGKVSGETVVAKVSGEAVGRTWTLSWDTDAVQSLVSGQIIQLYSDETGRIATILADGDPFTFGTIKGIPVFGGDRGAGTAFRPRLLKVQPDGKAVVAMSGETVVTAGRYYPRTVSGEEDLMLVESGAIAPPLADRMGRQVVRVDRVHISGGYARYDVNIVRAQGDTVIETPGSGRALRLKAIQDSYMGNSGSVLVAYRFGPPPAAHFLRHQIGANFPNWGINLVGAEIQGAFGAELRMNLSAPLSSGVEFTIVMEEVISGSVF